MKKVTFVALIIFGIISSAVIAAGLLLYENKKNMDDIGGMKDEIGHIMNTLNKDLVAFHNSKEDCWMILDGKVYDLSGYFDLHPGGNEVMIPYCGKDGSSAFKTKDLDTPKEHSDYVMFLLNDYLIGSLGEVPQIINQKPAAKKELGDKLNNQTELKVNDKSLAPSTASKIVLTLAELAKHNKPENCWMLINGKVYDITLYFGMHPGGNSTMISSCGKESSSAYQTKGGEGKDHSTYARELLADYYLGDLGASVDRQATDSSTVSEQNSKKSTNLNSLIKVIEDKYPGATSVSGKKEDDGAYEAKFFLDGIKFEVKIDLNGKVIKEESEYEDD